MMTPNAWKKTLFVCKELETEEMDDMGNFIDGYDTPVEIKLNYQPVKAETALKETGETTESMYRAIVHQGTPEFDMFEVGYDEGALVYLHNASPTTQPKGWTGSELIEPKNGAWANYKVFSIRPSNLTKVLYFVQFTV